MYKETIRKFLSVVIIESIIFFDDNITDNMME